MRNCWQTTTLCVICNNYYEVYNCCMYFYYSTTRDNNGRHCRTTTTWKHWRITTDCNIHKTVEFSPSSSATITLLCCVLLLKLLLQLLLLLLSLWQWLRPTTTTTTTTTSAARQTTRQVVARGRTWLGVGATSLKILINRCDNWIITITTHCSQSSWRSTGTETCIQKHMTWWHNGKLSNLQQSRDRGSTPS